MPAFNNIIKSTAVILFALLSGYLHAQRCDWLETGGGFGMDRAHSMATDPNNNILVTGSYGNGFSIGPFVFSQFATVESGFIIKYDEYGQVKWTKSFGGTSFGLCYPTVVQTDANSNVYIAGHVSMASGSVDFGNGVVMSWSSQQPIAKSFLVKFDSLGTAQWVVEYGGGAQTIGRLHEISVDNAGNIYHALTFSHSLHFPGIFKTIVASKLDIGIIKITPGGTVINAVNFGSAGYNYILQGMGIDERNNPYIIGYAGGGSLTVGGLALNGPGVLVLKLDSALTALNGLKTNINSTTPHTVIEGQPFFDIAVCSNGRFVV
ncbi:MAG TPA: hypothetical protein VEC12_03735, partial [Bacteroidia bacterium]|nr:hypothetical protein [Bacteroidia bacterium]